MFFCCIVIRKVKKEDFDQYEVLRKEGLEGYQKLTEEKLKILSKQIKEEFEGIFSNKNRIMFVIELSRRAKKEVNSIEKIRIKEILEHLKFDPIPAKL